MSKHRFAIALGVVIFLVLTGGGVASAYWATTAQITAPIEAASLDAACVNPTSVVNASFEIPAKNSLTQTPDSQVTGWTSLPDHNIEIWVHNTHENVPAPVGRQFVELNAHVPGTLSQTITTAPGQTLQWSLLHRGRWGVDTMEVRIGAAGGTPVPQATISDGQTWNRYSGVYVVPAGQTSTQLSFRAVSTSSGDQSVGNFLDDVSFGSGPCLVATSTVANKTNPAGPYRVGDLVEYVTTVKNTGSSPSFDTALSNTLPASVQYKANSLKIGTSAMSDGANSDAAEAVNGTLTARLGVGVAGNVGGSIAQGTETTFTFQATVLAGASGTTVSYTPTVDYINYFAPDWNLSVVAPDAAFSVAALPALSTLTCSPSAPRSVTIGWGHAAEGAYAIQLWSGGQWISAGTATTGATGYTLTADYWNDGVRNIQVVHGSVSVQITVYNSGSNGNEYLFCTPPNPVQAWCANGTNGNDIRIFWPTVAGTAWSTDVQVNTVVSGAPTTMTWDVERYDNNAMSRFYIRDNEISTVPDGTYSLSLNLIGPSATLGTISVRVQGNDVYCA